MKRFVLIAVAVSSLLMVSCGDDGCTVGDTKCSGNNVMYCQIASLTNFDDGNWELQQECTDDTACVYSDEYEVHRCE